MKELGYSNTEIPSEIPADKCMIRMKTQDLQPAATAQTMVGIYDADDKVGFLTWPGDLGEVVAVLSGGHRFVLVLFRTDLITKEEKRYYYTSAGNWVETEMTTVSEIGQKAGEDAIIQIAAGETKELKSFE
ncbi:MAG: hypothetical protein K5897_11505 [Eubacterium sp.]|nr:hypothetical protein [Eubacterium sp.]